MASAERKEIYPVSLEQFYRSILDFENYPNFISSISKVEVREKTASSAKLYFEVEMIKKVHYEISLNFSINEAKNQAKMSWTLDSSPFFKLNNGSWDLQAKSPSSVQAFYKLELDFVFPVPGLLLRGLVAKALPQAMEDFYLHAKGMKA